MPHALSFYFCYSALQPHAFICEWMCCQVMKRPDGLLSRDELRARAAAAARKGPGGATEGTSQGGLLASLALLQRGGRPSDREDPAADGGAVEDGGGGENAAGEVPQWQPPQGQRGDGRTKMNDVLGY